jgi:hypothetical protein
MVPSRQPDLFPARKRFANRSARNSSEPIPNSTTGGIRLKLRRALLPIVILRGA